MENNEDLTFHETKLLGFLSEFSREGDRVAVILGVAKLDLMLHQLIQQVLLPCASGRDDLFDGDAPLSTFNAKINMAYRLGLVDAGFARALHLVRKIRNAFAHEASGCSLTSKPYKDQVRELIAPFKTTSRFTVGFARLKERLGLEDPSVEFRYAAGEMIIMLELTFDRWRTLPGDYALSLSEPEINRDDSEKNKERSS